MAYLLDTNVVSMFAPGRVVPPAFVEWLGVQDREARLFLSVVTIHEIEKGIALLDAKGGTAKASALRGWLDGLTSTYGECIVAIDPLVCAVSGKLEARAIADGHSPGMADALIAGTAKAHGLAVVTKNTRHFIPFGIDLAEPDDCKLAS